MVGAKTVYGLLEGFVLWDNYHKKGPWGLGSAENKDINPSAYKNVFEFSADKVKKAGGSFDENAKKLAYTLYSIGPVYGLKAISELDVAGFSASGIAPKGICPQASIDQIIARYEKLCVWLPFIESTAKEVGKEISFTSQTGPVLKLNTDTLECVFEYFDMSKKIVDKVRDNNLDALRVVDLLVKAQGLPDSKYSAIKNMLSRQLSVLTSKWPADHEPLWHNLLSTVGEKIGIIGYKDYLELVKKNDKENNDPLALLDGSGSPEYKNGFVQLMCGFVESSLWGDLGADLSKACLPPYELSKADSKQFDPRSLILSPRKNDNEKEEREEAQLYFETMKSGFDSLYPSYGFPLVNKLLGLRFTGTTAEGLKEEFRRLSLGTVYVNVVPVLEELHKDASGLGVLKGIQTWRIIMDLFGQKETEAIKVHYKGKPLYMEISVVKALPALLLKIEKKK